MLKILVIQEWVLFFLMGDLGVAVFVNCECSVLSLQWQRVVIAMTSGDRKCQGLKQFLYFYQTLKHENPINPRYPFHHYPHACQDEEISFLAPSQVE